MNPYETERLLAEYLLFHYGTAQDVLGGLPGPTEAVGFATRLVDLLLDTALLPASPNALDVGCAVGGSSFALARWCAQVLGVDFSARFIDAARSLGERGSLSLEVVEQGRRLRSFTARVPESIDRNRVRFSVGDAQNLPASWANFDVVLAANLLCRLPKPEDFIRRLSGLVKPGGQLLLTTPFTWMEEFTPVENWLGGTPEAGESWAVLQRLLNPDFELATRMDVPLLLREHGRKFQYTVTLGSRWIRRNKVPHGFLREE